MRILLFAFIVLYSCKSDTNPAQVSNKEKINWLDISQLDAAVKAQPRNSFVMVYADWCPHCKRFDESTYLDPKLIADLNTLFHPVKLNAHESREITFKGKNYGNPTFDSSKSKDEVNSYHDVLYEIDAKSVPSIVFLDRNLSVLGTEMGYKAADELRSIIHMYK